MKRTTLLLLWLLVPALLSGQRTSGLDAYFRARQEARQEREMALTQEAQRKRLQAETELLHEQAQLLREQRKQQPRQETEGTQATPETSKVSNDAIATVSARYPDIDLYADRMALLSDFLNGAKDSRLAAELHIESLYLLSKYGSHRVQPSTATTENTDTNNLLEKTPVSDKHD